MVPCLVLYHDLPLLVHFLLLHVKHLAECEFCQLIIRYVRLRVELFDVVVEGVEYYAETGSMNVE